MTKPFIAYFANPYLLRGISAAVVLVLLACRQSSRSSASNGHEPSKAGLSQAALTTLAQSAMSGLGRNIGGELTSTAKQHALDYRGPVYVSLRGNGRRLAETWVDDRKWREGFEAGIQNAARLLETEERDSVDSVEACLVYGYAPPKRQSKSLPQNSDRGVMGIAIEKAGSVVRYAPTSMIARNRSFSLCCKDAGYSDEDIANHQVPFSKFFAHQVLINLSDGTAQELFRGNRLVPLDSVNAESVDALSAGMAAWLANNTANNGELTYKYWPSRGEKSSSNNTIRQLLGTLALQHWARYRRDPKLEELAERNLEFNLDRFYRKEGNLGFVYDGESIKLGAVALMALAVVSSSTREQHANEEKALLATVDRLFQPDTGAFHSFANQPNVEDNQNFYPGEALLLWATLFAESGDKTLLTKIMKSFLYYREWHRRARNPAFVPWHTQAYCLVWQRTHDDSLRDFVFEMNDWLIATQQLDDAPYPDMRGRFYSPSTKGYGPPHSSSTGVYLEGLVAAYKLAKASSDNKRALDYRTAILEGVRNIMQLQFTDDVDMYYISKRKSAFGGIRTTEYNNEIRVDNVAHNLLASVSMLEIGLSLLPGVLHP